MDDRPHQSHGTGPASERETPIDDDRTLAADDDALTRTDGAAQSGIARSGGALDDGDSVLERGAGQALSGILTGVGTAAAPLPAPEPAATRVTLAAAPVPPAEPEPPAVPERYREEARRLLAQRVVVPPLNGFTDESGALRSFEDLLAETRQAHGSVAVLINQFFDLIDERPVLLADFDPAATTPAGECAED